MDKVKTDSPREPKNLVAISGNSLPGAGLATSSVSYVVGVDEELTHQHKSRFFFLFEIQICLKNDVQIWQNGFQQQPRTTVYSRSIKDDASPWNGPE